jgi:hypothetical protein
MEAAMIPFTAEQFFEAFAEYNRGIWPAQLVLFGLATFAAAACFFRHSKRSHRLVGGVLGLLWAATAVLYHVMYFTAVTPAAYGFAALFLAGAFVLLARKEPLMFGASAPSRQRLGAALVIFALLVYPALGYALGHRYPAMPTFGAPCPLVIFTLGLLVTVKPRIPAALVAIAAIWALFATSAAIQFGIYEDFGLTTAATVVAIIVWRERRTSHSVMHDRARHAAAQRESWRSL